MASKRANFPHRKAKRRADALARLTVGKGTTTKDWTDREAARTQQAAAELANRRKGK